MYVILATVANLVILFILLFTLNRYSSRALLIPFIKPAVGPENQVESCAFNEMSTVLRSASSAVGWAISLGDVLKEEVTYLQGDLCKRVRERLPGIDSRLITGYATCLFFAEKVASCIVCYNSFVFVF